MIQYGNFHAIPIHQPVVRGSFHPTARDWHPAMAPCRRKRHGVRLRVTLLSTVVPWIPGGGVKIPRKNQVRSKVKQHLTATIGRSWEFLKFGEKLMVVH